MLKRYSILAFLVIAVEIMLIFLFRTPLKDSGRVPQTFEEFIFRSKTLTASLMLDLFVSEKTVKEISKKVSRKPYSLLDQKLINYGLVNIQDIDSSIFVNLKYATSDNFLKKNLYGDLKNCYLQKDMAQKLANANALLKKRYPFYSIIIFDGVRPLSIQQTMWDELQVPEASKDKYVSNPEVGSLHNYGCAVDVSIVNEDGWEMDMGTPYDFFGELGHPIAEHRMIAEGKLSWRQYENRKLLREVMYQSGFTGITTEWWHFNGISLKTASEKYKIVE